MQVSIQCPLCNSSGNIEVPATLTQNITRGLVSVNVPSAFICQHNFQLFLDRNGAVRGYQKIDYQVWVSGGESRQIESEQKGTEFRCKLCNTNIRFSIDDTSTFLTKREHKEYFGMQLSTYQIAHVFKNEMHLNSVIVDENGVFQGYIEGYPLPLSKFLIDGITPSQELTFRLLDETMIPLNSHRFINILYIINAETLQILDLICPPFLNIVEMAKLTHIKIQEIEKIYRNISECPIVKIADKEFRVWISGKTMLIASFVGEDFLSTFNQIARKLVEYSFDVLIDRFEHTKIALKFLEKQQISDDDIQVFFRLINDDRFFSKIQIKYPENLPRIVTRLKQEFGIKIDVLEPFLFGQKSINQLLTSDLVTNASELLEMIDFIERRRLLA
ncbi:MAG: hypothetical protein RBG13Loki_3471 [Promethearchaeota archaeon CR_4]|nr:MAG: hypothetical protein RBG13Loki_3471 [Candidatus Lokiarchaeota archaeon CR_4]